MEENGGYIGIFAAYKPNFKFPDRSQGRKDIHLWWNFACSKETQTLLKVRRFKEGKVSIHSMLCELKKQPKTKNYSYSPNQTAKEIVPPKKIIHQKLSR